MSLSHSPELSFHDVPERGDRLRRGEVRAVLEEERQKRGYVGGSATVAVEVAFLRASRDGARIGVGAERNRLVLDIAILIPGAGLVSSNSDHSRQCGR